jgi:manganese transport protein
LSLPAKATEPREAVSLEGIHSSVEVPHHHAGFWKTWRAFVGPAFLVCVGYMDPGNWGTDLAAGAQFKYGLLWVVAVASFMAIFLQVMSARLGVVTGKDLAQCCRDFYPKWSRWPQWILCELAIAACDLAEVLGSAVAINLLFHIPLFYAVLITAADVLLLLGLQRFGMRMIEAFVLVLVLTITGCYFIEIFVIPQTQPSFAEMGSALIRPGFREAGMVYVAIGILGATVMPHNLYLHSALVQSRRLEKDDASIRRAIKFNTIDSTVALVVAFFVNAAILVLAAMVFYGKQHVTLPSGQSSTITSTLAGQVVMEGFMRWKLSPTTRRLVTRLAAIVPAILVIGVRGEGSVNDLLTLSQVVLALQLPFAMFPLLQFTSSRKYMGKWKNGPILLIIGWASGLLITALDIYGLPESLKEAWHIILGR